MHEMGLIRALIRKIEAIAQSQKLIRVSGVSVWLGALSHFSPEHFREHFKQASAGTLAEGASLSIEHSTDLSHPNAQDVLLRSIDA